MDGYCFEPLSDETLNIAAIGSYIPIDLMNQFECTELVQNMRQKDDAPYQQLLLDVRVGNLNAEQAAMLESRVVKDSYGKPKLNSPKEIASYLCELLKEDENTICLVPTVEKMNAVNLECLNLLGNDLRPIPAEHSDKKARNDRKENPNNRKVSFILYFIPFLIKFLSLHLIYFFRELQLVLEDWKKN